MVNLEKLTAAEIKSYISGQTRNLKLLQKLLIITIVVIVVAVIGHVIYYYNYLTNLKFDLITAQAKVASAMQYRANLVPILIESVVSFVEHEDNVFNRTVDARERSLGVVKKATTELQKSAGKPMGDILQKIMAIAEQYPDLKTAEPFQLLMTKTSETEAEIYKQRIEMNDMINVYTTAIAMFPGNFYSTVLFDFPDYDYFKGKPYSEWPTFEGKKHSGWPRVSVQTLKGKDGNKDENN